MNDNVKQPMNKDLKFSLLFNAIKQQNLNYNTLVSRSIIKMYSSIESKNASGFN